jgi:hypothetical protein
MDQVKRRKGPIIPILHSVVAWDGKASYLPLAFMRDFHQSTKLMSFFLTKVPLLWMEDLRIGKQTPKQSPRLLCAARCSVELDNLLEKLGTQPFGLVCLLSCQI